MIPKNIDIKIESLNQLNFDQMIKLIKWSNDQMIKWSNDQIDLMIKFITWSIWKNYQIDQIIKLCGIWVCLSGVFLSESFSFKNLVRVDSKLNMNLTHESWTLHMKLKTWHMEHWNLKAKKSAYASTGFPELGGTRRPSLGKRLPTCNQTS